MEITLKNAARILSAYKKAPEDVSRGIQRAIERSGVYTEGQVKTIITSGLSMWKPPIKTGQMRQGIHATFHPGKTVVSPSANTPYAAYVHEGTKRMKARPFFQITKDARKDNIQSFFTTELNAAISKLAI